MKSTVNRALPLPHPGRLAAAAVLFGALASPLTAQPVKPSDFDILGEVTGCAAPSLCGDFGGSVASAGDVNGDWIPDLVIGAPTVSDANPSTGRVYVFFGPIDGDLRAERADVTITGLEFGDLVGTARSGDLNDDGLSDIVIGSRGPDIDGGILNGQVWVFYAPLGGDLLVSDADATITGTNFSELGRSLTVGDFNDDGTDDVLAGASQTASGKAHLFYGPIFGELSSLDADAIVSGTLGFEELGESVAAVDLNDDGIDDLVLGAPNFPLGDITAGSVYVFFGPIFGEHSSAEADVTIFGEEINDEFGSHMAAGGDINDDGFEDLLVGAWQLFKGEEPGKAYVFYGPLETGTRLASEADAILWGEPRDGNYLFGILAGAGDVNADGFDDVVVGAQFAGPDNHGRAYVFHGPLTGEITAADADWIFDAPGFDPDQGLDFLGRAVGAAGDLDGNGFDDVLLGAPGSDGPGLTRVVMAPGLTIEATPRGSLVLPPEGGTINFKVTLTNTSTGIRSLDAWLEVTADKGETEVRRGPVSLPFDPTSDFHREASLDVPGTAPPGTYTVTVAAGNLPHAVTSDSFHFEKQAAQ